MATINNGSDGYGYVITVSRNNYHPEYIHDNRVDGSTRYGEALNGFPRRNQIGGQWASTTTCGSRSVYECNCTSRTSPYVSACMILYRGNDC